MRLNVVQNNKYERIDYIFLYVLFINGFMRLSVALDYLTRVYKLYIFLHILII